MTERGSKITDERYRGLPIRVFEGTYHFQKDPAIFGTEIGDVPVHLAIHPNQSRRIILNIPGYNGVIDGYADKYKLLASHMQQENLGAVVRTGNTILPGFLPDINLRSALKYAEEHASTICGEPEPELMLMGFSAGASAIAAIAHEYPAVSRILLFAPSGNMPRSMLVEGLKKFQGEITIVQGEDDDVVGPFAGQRFYDMATGARTKELFTLRNCDHQFRGEANGRILSQAPFYAFAKDQRPEFLDPAGGITLY